MGCMPALTTNNPFHRPQAAATASAVASASHRGYLALHFAGGAEAAADHQRRHRRGDGHHRAHRDVEPAHRDDQRHAQRHDDERRGAIEDVDDAAVQMAVAPREREERRVEQAARDEQQRQRDRRPEQARVASRRFMRCGSRRSVNTPRPRSAPRGSSPALARSRSTMMRSETRTTSSISAEMNSTAVPPRASSRISFISSCLAAMSMPRVGSSSISTRGCVASQRAMMAFC